MTHYEKLATMLFRLIGTFFLIFGGISALAALIFISGEPRMAFWIALFYSLPTIIFGITFCSLGKKLAKWICFDFDKFNE